MKSFLFGRCGWAAFLTAGLSAGLTGCASCKPGDPGKPKAYAVQIKLDDNLKDKSVFVDVIAANASDLETLRTYSVEKYWTPNNRFRQDQQKVPFSFVGGSLSSELYATDERWKSWLNAGIRYLVVIAFLPDVHDDKPGLQDTRRQILPICNCYWPSGTTNLQVEVQPSRVRIATIPRRPGEPPALGW